MFKLKLKPLPAKKKGKKAEKNDESVQLRQDFQAAFQRYAKAVGCGRFNRKHLLYSHPWFLICGSEESGKSTLLNETGISWIEAHPDDPDGQIQWRFSQDAVWIDIPGEWLTESASKEFQVFVETLAWMRPRRPLDGIVLVADCEEILETESNVVERAGTALRKKIDQLTRQWGIELPVYTVFNKADTITGFNEIFSDPRGKWNERIMGTSLSSVFSENEPGRVFLTELTLVLDWVREIQVKMLARDQDSANRRLICQFPIVLESMRNKISKFITAIFNARQDVGHPLFGGFFFTSCQLKVAGGKNAENQIFDVSKTIVSHPLYPSRKKKRADVQGFSDKSREKVKCFFAQPLFSNVIPKHAAPISITGQRIKQNIVSLIWKCGIAVTAAIIISLFLWRAAVHVRTVEKKVYQDFTGTLSQSGGKTGNLRIQIQHYRLYKKYVENGRPFSMWITRYNAKRMYDKIRDAFFLSVYKTVVLPAADEMKEKLQWMVRLSENSPDNDFMKLKQMLQTYLAISDSNVLYFEDIYTTDVIDTMLFSMVATSHLGASNITSEADTVLRDVVHEYLEELKNNEKFDYKISFDPDLVVAVRRKLGQMFDFNAVYRMVSSELTAKSRMLDVADVVGNSMPLNMRSLMKISEIYTPAGWNDYVKKKFQEESLRRRQIENWATDSDKQNNRSKFKDTDKLYSQIVKCYCDDMKTEWRNFFNSISIERFSSLMVGKERLLQMGGAQSDIAKLITTFSDWSAKFISNDSGEVTDPSITDFTNDMAFIRHFAQSNLAEYQTKLDAVAQGIEKASESGAVVDVFKGGDDDPLVTGYQFVENSIIMPLSKYQKDYLARLLMQPYKRTVSLLKPKLEKELNDKWDVISNRFNGPFSTKYPFVESPNEVLLTQVVEFFKPVSGILWNTYQDYFKPYVTFNESTKKYTYRKASGIVPVKFTPDFFTCLNKADTITRVLYSGESPKMWSVTILPKRQATDLRSAKIQLGETSVELMTEYGKPLKWPVDGDMADLHLVITDNLKRSGKIDISGPWALMRLMHRVSSYSRDRFQSEFEAQFRVLYTSMVEIDLSSIVKVTSLPSGSFHPFCKNVFREFKVPGHIIRR